MQTQTAELQTPTIFDVIAVMPDHAIYELTLLMVSKQRKPITITQLSGFVNDAERKGYVTVENRRHDLSNRYEVTLTQTGATLRKNLNKG